MNINDHSKIDHKTLHFLPFTPSRKRVKGFSIERVWGQWQLNISASETLNVYDLINLLYIVKEYLLNGYSAGYIGDGEERREVAGIKIDVKKILKLRGISTNKNNRRSFKDSVIRLKTINLIFKNLKQKKEIYTSYIYEFEVDENIERIKIFANKSFIDFVVENGVLINIERLKKYIDDKNIGQYAILLDLYLQGTKVKYKKGRKEYYAYRNQFSFDELEKALKLDLTEIPQRNKKMFINQTFKILHQKNDLPLYKYNEIRQVWEKQKRE